LHRYTRGPDGPLTNQSCANTMSSNVSIPLGVWTHISVVVNGTAFHENVTNLTAMGGNHAHKNVSQATVSFFIDGKPAGHFVNNTRLPKRVGVAPVNNTFHVSAGTPGHNSKPDLWFGRLGSVCNCLSYKGLIDEFRLWEDALNTNPSVADGVHDISFWADYKINIWHTVFHSLVAYVQFEYSNAKPDETMGLSVLRNSTSFNPLEDTSMKLYLNGTSWILRNLTVFINGAPPAPSPPPPPPPSPPPPPPSPPPPPAAVHFRHEHKTYGKVPRYHPGALTPTIGFTLEAWLNPDQQDPKNASLQTIMMLGHQGFGVFLMCDGVAGEMSGDRCCPSVKGVKKHLPYSVGFYAPRSSLADGTARSLTAAVCANATSSNASLTPGKWNHVGVVVNNRPGNQRVEFFVNGVPAGSFAGGAFNGSAPNMTEHNFTREEIAALMTGVPAPYNGTNASLFFQTLLPAGMNAAYMEVDRVKPFDAGYSVDGQPRFGYNASGLPFSQNRTGGVNVSETIQSGRDGNKVVSYITSARREDTDNGLEFRDTYYGDDAYE
jgi:hypothetical protein